MFLFSSWQIVCARCFEDVFFGSILGESIIDLVIIGLPFEFKASQKLPKSFTAFGSLVDGYRVGQWGGI